MKISCWVQQKFFCPCVTTIPWELCESLLILWNSEAVITTRLSVQVSVFHKISIIQGKMWHGVGVEGATNGLKGHNGSDGRPQQVHGAPPSIKMLSPCLKAHSGLRFLLKMSTPTSHQPLNSCQQLIQNTVIHQTQTGSSVSLSWPIHLHCCGEN